MGPAKLAFTMLSRLPLWATVETLLCYQWSRECCRHFVLPDVCSDVKVPSFLAHHFTSIPPLRNPSTTISTAYKTKHNYTILYHYITISIPTLPHRPPSFHLTTTEPSQYNHHLTSSPALHYHQPCTLSHRNISSPTTHNTSPLLPLLPLQATHHYRSTISTSPPLHR
jgi:hypothetical protein